MLTSKSWLFTFLAFGLIFTTMFVTSEAAKKDKDADKDSNDGEEEVKEKGKERERFYKKRDLERITQLLADINEMMIHLQEEQSFLTELLISSFSIGKPEVDRVQNVNMKRAFKSLTKSLAKFYTGNTLTGRPSKLVAKHLQKHPFPVPSKIPDETALDAED